MLRNNHSSRKRAASEEPDEYESEPEISISSLDNATKNEGMIGKRARIDNESTKTREDNSESFGKPEAAEYLWDLVGKNQSSEPSYNQFDSGTSWGYDTEDNPKCGATGEDKGDGCLEDSTFGPSEELPTANEIIGESIATRRYNADGLTDPSTYPKPPTFKTTEDLEIRTSYKPTKDVGWMMGQMGLE
ncbi:hypothetical protein PtA15_9A363 [Puccinia triticina]|uniref:Uncharacterized protein n=1 Tax=Puccinia triticina TaxID=208348 RepID=A0ABY7CSK7_9BASI|nr:uncharacterized protein PtA15_9A363 [Puccinia triticina]WAQ88236.1 hypothetical protein PtA15_9A363 [Puccinia triticina]